MLLRLTAAACLVLALALPSQARTICTVVADAHTGAILLQDGDCASRATPASTFKIPLAVIGFDTALLTDPHAPAWPFRDGYPDWGGAAWRQDTDPAHWMKHSVVWYSQEITRRLGSAAFAASVAALDYGNADVTGDPGYDNGLERSWISSSLQVSPLEQVGFLRRLLKGNLPVSSHASEATQAIVEANRVGAWTIWGKTGSAFPRNADRSFDRAHGWGWYVGWAKGGNSTLVFARLTQDEGGEKGSAGLRTRDGLLADWAGLAAAW
jgi:beta-lactamase class D